MIIVGDIGNTETKICLVNSKNKIVKRLHLKTNNINISLLKKSFKKINSTRFQFKKCLFSSVVPKSFRIIKIFFEKVCNVQCFELKNLL